MLSVRTMHEFRLWIAFAAMCTVQAAEAYFTDHNYTNVRVWTAIVTAQAIRILYFVFVHRRRQDELRRQEAEKRKRVLDIESIDRVIDWEMAKEDSSVDIAVTKCQFPRSTN
jgi:hypothetical protein